MYKPETKMLYSYLRDGNYKGRRTLSFFLSSKIPPTEKAVYGARGVFIKHSKNAISYEYGDRRLIESQNYSSYVGFK